MVSQRLLSILAIALAVSVPALLDHVDRNRQNNALRNLRPASPTDNAGNSSLPRHNTSGLKGASLNRKSGKWHAQIKVKGKQTYLGRFDTAAEAHAVYLAAAKLHFGGFAHA